MTDGESQPSGKEETISVSPPADQPSGTGALPSCGDFDIRIARDGTWFYRGSPIGRKPLVKLFASVLRREADGEFWLVTPVERGRVTVEDAPFTAVELSVTRPGPDQVLRFRTNVDDWVEAGPEHPIRVALAPGSGEPSPYVLVRAGLEALLLRSVYYHLVELAVEAPQDETAALGVWSQGHFFPLGAPE